MPRAMIFGLALILTGAGLCESSQRAANPTTTAITIPDMCCKGCAKNVFNQMMQVPGVAGVQADLKAKIVMVHPLPEKAPSPRAMWEAVEKANKTPTRLQGPAGTFTSKPQS